MIITALNEVDHEIYLLAKNFVLGDVQEVKSKNNKSIIYIKLNLTFFYLVASSLELTKFFFKIDFYGKLMWLFHNKKNQVWCFNFVY